MIRVRKATQFDARCLLRILPGTAILAGCVLLPIAAHAAGSPWENAVNALEVSFTGPIARGLSLVAIVLGGLTFAFTEGGDGKRMLAGIIFGLGMALSSIQFLSWLFP